VVQVGGLPLEGAQVVIESIATAKKEVNPHGLLFVSGQAVLNDNPLGPVAALVQSSLDGIGLVAAGNVSTPKDVLRVTCFVSSLQDINEVRGRVLARYSAAVLNVVQTQRAPMRGIAECEAVARLSKPVDGVALLNPEGIKPSPNYSQAAAVSAPKVTLSGTQSAYGFADGDARLAFQRLGKALEAVGTTYADVVMSSIYPLSTAIRDQVSKIRFEFYDSKRPPASTMLLFEGLPSMDAGFAVDVVAIPRK
jgi:enamine deaminase RidA (YjgF/YER057c/UK114 family)